MGALPIVMRIDTTASVGSIPLESTVSPSGAQVYSIAIPTVEDIRFAPQLSLMYNSQSGQGVAGWGWGIGGLSSVTLSSRNMYYHGEVAPADVSDTSAVWRLDGSLLIPCTEEAFVQSGYQLQSERGRVMVKVHRLQDGRVAWFETLSPDGSSAVYGWSDGSRPSLVTYPVTEQRDRFGGIISYSYRSTHHNATNNDTFSIQSVTYGIREGEGNTDTAEVEFLYSSSSRADVTPVYYAGTTMSETALMTGIRSRATSGDTLWRYTFTQEANAFGDILLTKIDVLNSQDRKYNPILFRYGRGEAVDVASADFERQSIVQVFYNPPQGNLGAVGLEDDQEGDDPENEDEGETDPPVALNTRDYIFKRGKYLPDSYQDGLVIYKNNNVFNSLNNYRHYQSPLYWAPCADSLSNIQPVLRTLTAFNVAEAIDVDGDGQDEFVTVSVGNRIQTGNSYHLSNSFTVWSYNRDSCRIDTPVRHTMLSTAFHTSDGKVYAHGHDFRFGDFIGNGTMQLICFTQSHSGHSYIGSNKVSLFDLQTGQGIHEEYNPFYWDGDPSRIIVQDVDGDGRTEFCYARNDSLLIWHYRNAPVPPDPEEEPLDPDDPEYEEPEIEYAWQYVLDKAVTIPTSVFNSRTLVGDFNCDGLLDIISIPAEGSVWTQYFYDGEKFNSVSSNVTDCAEVDEFHVQDINHDNLPDVMKQHLGRLHVFYNEKGVFSSDKSFQSNVYVDNIHSFVACNKVRFREADDFILTKSDSAGVYRLALDRAAERLLTAVQDGYGTLTTHSYSDLTADWAYITDPGRVLSADSLYHKRRIPLMVVDSTSVSAWTPGRGNLIPAGAPEGTSTAADLTLLSSTSYRYTDAVVGSRGLGFCGFGAMSVKDDIPDGGYVDVQTTVFDPEMSGVPLSQTATKRDVSTGQSSVYSSSSSVYSNRPVSADARFNPLPVSSTQTDHLQGITKTTQVTYDEYDAPVLQVIAYSSSGTSLWPTPPCVTPTDSVRTEYLHSHSPTAGRYLLSQPTRTVSSSSYTGSLLSPPDGTVIVRDSMAITYDNATLLPLRTESRRQTTRYRYLSEEESGWSIVQGASPLLEPQVTGEIGTGTQVIDGGGSASVQVNPRDSLPELPDPFHPIIDTLPVLRFLAVSQSDVLMGEQRWTYDSMGNVLTDTSCGPDGVTFTGDTYSYDESGRHLITHTDAMGRTTTYSEYNAFGKPTAMTDGMQRTTTVTYDAWGQETQRVLPDGTLIKQTLRWDITSGGYNGAENTNPVIIDGRQGEGAEHLSGGTPVSLGTRFARVTTQTGSPTMVTRYDALQREVAVYGQTFDGGWRGSRTRYDLKGREAIATRPHRLYSSQGDPLGDDGPVGVADTLITSSDTLAVYSYDRWSRPVLRRESSGRQKTWSYFLRTSTETEDGVTRSRTVDARGRLARTDDDGGHILYFYTGGDLLREICVRVAGTRPYSGTESLPPLNTYATTGFLYNEWGERVSIDDPCAGKQIDSTLYNSDGSRTLRSINARGTTVTRVDRYGRTLSEVRTPADSLAAAGVPTQTLTYVYDDDATALSQLGLSSQAGDGSLLIYESVTAAQGQGGGGSNGATSSSLHYTYDSLDRLTSVKETAPGGRWFRQDYSYLQGGSVLQSTSFTEGAGANDVNGTALGTESYTYANGHQTKVDFAKAIAIGTAPASADTVTVWQLTAENDFGQPTSGVSGPLTRNYSYDQWGLPTGRSIAPSAAPNNPLQSYSYVFDHATGNLSSRADGVHSTTESFTYDGLNRLVGTTLTTGVGSGNEVTSSGTYSFGASTGVIYQKSEEASMSYQGGTKPYILTSAQDLELNTQRYPGDVHILYNTTWRPHAMSKTGVKAIFDYGPDGERVRMEVADSTQAGTITCTARYYFGGGRFEVDSTAVSATTGGSAVVSIARRLYLMGNSYKAPAVYTTTTASGGNGSSMTASQILFIGRDYLGSITELINEDGTLAASYSYDPWGRPRDPQTLEQYRTDGTDSTGNSAPTLLLGRGYTGHEWLPWFALYNANARLYDPLLGRFLEPDPYIQAPDFTQNFNRYAYCLNNPLKYTDESGEFIGTILTAILRLPVAIAKGIIAPFYVGFSDTAKAGRMFSNAWKEYGSKVSKAFKIDKGLFKVDPSRSLLRKVWDIFSRFTWESTSEFFGNAFSHIRNNFSNITVSYYRGATLVNRDNGSDSHWGMTTGSYINGKNLVADPTQDDVFAHEYGHTKQSQILGPAYLLLVGIPSLLGSGLERLKWNDHHYEWYEVWANQLAYHYYKKQNINPHPYFKDKEKYPRSQHANWYFYFTLLLYASYLVVI